MLMARAALAVPEALSVSPARSWASPAPPLVAGAAPVVTLVAVAGAAPGATAFTSTSTSSVFPSAKPKVIL